MCHDNVLLLWFAFCSDKHNRVSISADHVMFIESPHMTMLLPVPYIQFWHVLVPVCGGNPLGMFCRDFHVGSLTFTILDDTARVYWPVACMADCAFRSEIMPFQCCTSTITVDLVHPVARDL